jgi:hypothetical protein
MLLAYFTCLIYCQNEVVSLLLSLFVYNHILDDRISPNRTRRNIIVYEEIQSKTKAVDEVCLSINDRISAHTITELYDCNTGRCKTPYFSDYKRVCLTWANIDNSLMILGRNQIWWNAIATHTCQTWKLNSIIEYLKSWIVEDQLVNYSINPKILNCLFNYSTIE